MLIRCENIEELAIALGDSWELISEDIENHPVYKGLEGSGQPVYDFSSPTGLLQEVLNLSDCKAEGKTAFPIRVGPWWKRVDRYILARSKSDVESMFPGCKFLYGVALKKAPEFSDIDLPDPFMRRYARKKSGATN